MEPEISLTKFRAAAVWAAVRISPRWASSAFRGAPGRLAAHLDHRGGHVAQEPDRDLAVQVHVLDELRDVGVGGVDRQADEGRVPDAPGVTPLVPLPARVVGVRLDPGGRRRPLGDGPQVGRRRPAAADEVELVVEDEQVLRRGRLGVRRRFVQLVRADVEEPPVHVVHGEQRGRHAARAAQELPPADAEPVARLVGEFFDPRLDPLLLVGLRHRHVLAVGDHPRRDGGAE